MSRPPFLEDALAQRRAISDRFLLACVSMTTTRSKGLRSRRGNTPTSTEEIN
jgi:hypothetical protein